MEQNKYPYNKRIYTPRLREPLDSFRAFQIWTQHPNWNLKTLAEQTGIKYKKILKWSSKYKYFERRADKERDEWKQINQLALEAKIAAVEMASARSMKIQTALNARAELTTLKNVEILQKQQAGELKDYELELIDRHTEKTAKIENINLNNNKTLNDIVETVQLETDKVQNEFTRLNDILIQSRENAATDKEPDDTEN